MKKTLALVLALAMVFSTITVAFAEGTLGEDAQICADLGMLKGETGTVDAAYVATAPTRLQAAVMFLRLKGLEAEALAFTGEDNFADGNIAWAEGANLLAYLKANPQLGWIGDGVSFNPTAPMTAQAYYKVLLEALGYKQTTAEVAGDFTWEEVLTFAASVGLSKVADVADFTVNDLAIATVEALKVNVKGTEKTLAATLVEAGVVDEAKAVAAGLVEEAAAPVSAAIDEVLAIGNAVVQVVFEEDVAESAGNIDNYAIEGVTIEDVVVAAPNAVRLYTNALTAGKLYTLTMGDQSIKFAGIAKVSDGPQITDVVSEDVEEVVIEFDRNVDFATATDVATYEIKGVTVVSAEIDPDEPDEVILTTEGLKDNTEYLVKVLNIKSVDLVNRKTTSEDFKSDYDTSAPKVSDAKADTNQRVIVTFNEKVTEESAEDLANYVIKVDETDGAEVEIISIEWDDDDENNVEIVTEAMDDKEDYKITISNIADQRKVPNVMTKAYSKSFESVDEDDKAPTYQSYTILSPTKFMIEFKDDSRLDKESVLDVSNYEFECDDSALDIENIEEYDSDTGYFKAIFTVEEMATEKCVLTMIDIMDEFGNAMKEKDVTFTPDEDDFASAKLLTAVVQDENHILLSFDTTENELDEDSAENIANYSIDGDIGTPTKAVFESKDVAAAVRDNTVLLTVNDLVDGKKYELAIDGLKDIAGNVLKLDEFAITKAATPFDTKVELDSADTLSKYVVALSFDEEVKYDDTTTTSSYVVLSKANNGLTDAVTLYAKAMGEDDEIIEFSNYGVDELDLDVTYYVYEIVGVKNKAGTALTYTPGAETVSVSASEKPEYAEFESIEQIDADTVKVVFSKNVKSASGTTTTAVTAYYGASNTSIALNMTVDSDDFIDETVYFRYAGGYTEDEDYKLNLYAYLVDEHGIPVVDDDDVEYRPLDTTDPDYVAGKEHIPFAGVTEFEGADADESKPDVDEVIALDRKYIEVTVDEFIESVNAGKFTIVNLDDDESEVDIASVTLGTDTFERDVIKIDLTDVLEARYEYELRLEAGAFTDFAGNSNDADTFTFDGTNLSQH